MGIFEIIQDRDISLFRLIKTISYNYGIAWQLLCERYYNKSRAASLGRKEGGFFYKRTSYGDFFFHNSALRAEVRQYKIAA